MTTKQFAGKVALITGASRGIGAATARLFAQQGATVVLASRSEEELAHHVEAIQADRSEAMAVKTDVADAASVESLVRRTVEAYGRFDVAVNNAGIGGGNMPLEGHATFTLGESTIEVDGGNIVIGPAGVPHTFINAGEGLLRTINIHPSTEVITEWLED